LIYKTIKCTISLTFYKDTDVVIQYSAVTSINNTYTPNNGQCSLQHATAQTSYYVKLLLRHIYKHSVIFLCIKNFSGTQILAVPVNLVELRFLHVSHLTQNRSFWTSLS